MQLTNSDKTFGHSHAATSPGLLIHAQQDPTVVMRLTVDIVEFSSLHSKH